MSLLTLEARRHVRAIPRRRPATRPRTARIGLLGCGTVGREVAAILIESQARIERETGWRLEVSRILVRDPRQGRGLDPSLFTDQIGEVLADSPDVVVELVGGVEAATTHVRAALERGIPVVTANKSLIAARGAELQRLARNHGVALAYEASVGAAIPIFAALRQLAGDDVRSIRGVLNGSCNHILTRMAEARLPFDAALNEAITQGFAEPDPTADISGRDTAEKLCVLAAALNRPIEAPSAVPTRGVESLTSTDIAAARQHGCVIKLLGELEFCERETRARVGPALVPRHHALARPRGPENAVLIESRYGGALLLQGRGAGPQPTASAVIGDVLRILNGEASAARCRPSSARAACRTWPAQRHWLRINAPDAQPDGVMAVLQRHGISTTHIEFKVDRVEAMTGPIDIARMQAASAELARESSVVIAPVLDLL